MLEYIFGNKSIEKVLFFLLKNDKCYATQLRRQFHTSISPLQQALERLEKGGVVVSFLEGKTRIYQLNPRYPFLHELCLFLKRVYEFLPDEIKVENYEPLIRKRPRRKGKPL